MDSDRVLTAADRVAALLLDLGIERVHVVQGMPSSRLSRSESPRSRW